MIELKLYFIIYAYSLVYTGLRKKYKTKKKDPYV